MSWEDVIKMKNIFGETVSPYEEKYLKKIMDEFLQDIDFAGSMGIVLQVALRMRNYFDKNSEVFKQSRIVLDAIDLAEKEAKKLQTLLKDKYVGDGNLLKEWIGMRGEHNELYG